MNLYPYISRIILSLVFFIVSSILISISASVNCSAVTRDDKGYFTGERSTSGDNDTVLPKIFERNKKAIPDDVDTKAEFVKFLKNANGAGSNRKTGSAFILCTILGKTFGSCKDANYVNNNRTVQDDGWTELENRLKHPNLDIEWNKSVEKKGGFRNTRYDPDNNKGHNDIYYYTDNDNTKRRAIRFSYDGDVRYAFFRDCANPYGDLDPLKDYDPSDFTLTPTVSVAPSTIEAGASFDVTPVITNSGTTKSTMASYDLVKTITNPSATGATTSGKFEFPVGAKRVLAYTETNTDYPPGTKVCFVLSVTPHTNDLPVTTAYSLPPPAGCVTIGKKPKIQIWGGDLSVGRTFGGGVSNAHVQTSSSDKSIGGTPHRFGSWVEYAIFATGTIKGVGSGAALAGTEGMTENASTVVCDSNKLTFTLKSGDTNCSETTTLGDYQSTKSIPDIASRYPTSGATPLTSPINDVGSLPNGRYTASGPLTINDGTIDIRKWAVINAPDSTITIAGNIDYYSGNDLKTISDIPQLVIIANKIIINSDVTKVDAWLVAKDHGASDGEISTCGTEDAKTVNECNEPLVINGPVMTNKLYLRRTAGSGAGADSGKAAETFNLRADAYLWAYSQASSTNGRVRTVKTTELPPRF